MSIYLTNSPPPLLSIILPTYNESENIVPLVQSIIKYLPNQKLEILVVDDQSPDHTAEIVKKKFRSDFRVHVIERTKNRGLALSIYEGVLHAKGSYIVVMDTDFNHDPSILPLMLNEKDTYDMIVGSRYIKGGGMQNKLRFFASYFFNLWIRLMLRMPTHDNLSGFFLLRKSCLNKIDCHLIFIGYGDYFIRLLYAMHNTRHTIKEIPVFYKDRLNGESKSKFFVMLRDYTKTVLEIMAKKIFL